MEISPETRELAKALLSIDDASAQKNKTFIRRGYEHELITEKNATLLWDPEVGLPAHASTGVLAICPTVINDKIKFNAWSEMISREVGVLND